MRDFEILHGHLFCGLGGGAAGFNLARPDIGTARARYRCVGGIDVDAAAVADFEQLAGVPGTVMDLFDRDQYRAFHGSEPPAGWREATTTDVHRAFGGERPNVIFLSAPCKGFSGLMAETKSLTDKYQALNRLTERGVMLTLEAYKDDPIELFVFENVPRIMQRGRHLLDRITALFRAYNYVVAETTHDCGELGELAQSRKRFLLVARHAEKVPPFLYEPVKRRLRAVGEVLGRMPLPGDIEHAGPMHRIPALQWKTWVRLAFVEAGNDWRSLNRLAVDLGVLQDYLIVPEHHHGWLGVRQWEAPTGTVAGANLPGNGAFSIADPRAAAGAAQYQQYGVMSMADTAGAVIGVKSPGQGTFSVADPRHYGPDKHANEYHIVPWDRHAGVVTSAGGKGACVQDIRPPGPIFGKYACAEWEGSTGTVIARSLSGQGACSVADPRMAGLAGTASTPPTETAALPDARDNLVCRITSLDGTWHRPFTTLELAALQSLVDPDERWSRDPKVAGELARHDQAERRQAQARHFALYGSSDQAWRERIGNAVPPAAACAIAEEMGRTLLLTWTGQTFALSSTPIWVRDIATALTLPGETAHV